MSDNTRVEKFSVRDKYKIHDLDINNESENTLNKILVYRDFQTGNIFLKEASESYFKEEDDFYVILFVLIYMGIGTIYFIFLYGKK